MQPNLNPNDVSKLMTIFRKLGLSVPKVLKAQTYLNSGKYSPEEKARRLFGLDSVDELSQFLESRLNPSELETLKNAIGIE